MKILAINKYYWKKGGSESVYFEESQLLMDNGHTVVPFSMKSPKNIDTPYSKYFVEEVDYNKNGIMNRISSAGKVIFSLDARAKIKSLLSEESFDIAHFHIFQHQISPSVFSPLRKKGIPIILTLHDLKPICPSYKNYVHGHVCEACIKRKFYNCLINKCTKGSILGSLVNTAEMYFHYAMGYYQNVDRYIAVSKFYKNKMIESGFPSRQIAYLPNYINTEEFYQGATNANYILYFGRLSDEKGICTYLDAANINKDIPHVIVGTGPLEQALRKQTVIYGLANVKFLGYKSGDELKKLLAESTCVVVPSEWYENCPMTILEAFASSRPVIGSNIGGIPELIDHETDGFIFEPGNADALSRNIRWVWNNKSKAREMGMEGYEKVRGRFNPKKHYEGLIDIYKKLIG